MYRFLLPITHKNQMICGFNGFRHINQIKWKQYVEYSTLPASAETKKSCCSVRWFREYKQWPEEIEWNIHSKPTIKEKTILADWNLCVWVLGMKMFCNQKSHTGFNEKVWEHKQSLYFDRTLGVNIPFNSSRVSWVYSGLNRFIGDGDHWYVGRCQNKVFRRRHLFEYFCFVFSFC